MALKDIVLGHTTDQIPTVLLPLKPVGPIDLDNKTISVVRMPDNLAYDKVGSALDGLSEYHRYPSWIKEVVPPRCSHGLAAFLNRPLSSVLLVTRPGPPPMDVMRPPTVARNVVLMKKVPTLTPDSGRKKEIPVCGGADGEPCPVDFEVDSPAIDPSLPLLECPPFASEVKGGETIVHDFYLLDAKQESLRLFSEISEDLRNHNHDMWV
ncbi:hypothetical protein EV702DRAFT_1047706 [Suillus placidus]|uniref:Uncharacterized protein n=1 Tax=Suillus placidus TaxID=48579 RepID=A0A9P7D0H8_9AGAM|nr:hypothetical protein EV702DRAFT_1047706 [Suillus placidus]